MALQIMASSVTVGNRAMLDAFLHVRQDSFLLFPFYPFPLFPLRIVLVLQPGNDPQQLLAHSRRPVIVRLDNGEQDP